MFQSLKGRIALIVSSVLLPISIAIAVYFAAREGEQIRQQAGTQATREVSGVIDILTVTDQQLQARVISGMKLLKARGEALGPVSVGEQVTIEGRTAPDLKFGGRGQAMSYDLVDGVADIAGGSVTVFSRAGQDFVRISTNVMKDGKRAIGTVLDPNGEAIAAIRQGRPFYGQVDILGNPYVTGYEPARDAAGAVSGIWYVGYKVDLAPLEHTVGRARLFGNGVLAVIDDHGKLRFHSSTVEEKTALAAIDPDQPGWIRVEQNFPAWKFRVVAAYPAAAVDSAVRWRGIAIMGGALAIGCALLTILLMLLQRLVLRPIGGEPQVAMDMMSRIAQGDLSVGTAAQPGSVIGECSRMSGRLAAIVAQVRNAAQAVHTAAGEISLGNDDLSQRTQQQAAAVEQTASSMEEMTATVSQNADNARQANQLAGGVRQQAERSGEIVTRTVQAMADINLSSRRIEDIIGVIDEIAFRTNLLALNAAVEAARAGEQGRGFAVVAGEVRALAQRSATAAKEIKDLIGESVEKVRVGTGLVDDSGRALAEIMQSVKKVSDIVAGISSASEDQARGIEEVNRALSQMDQTTQQNAALVEEAAAAAKSMAHQSEQLIAEVSYFRTGAAETRLAVTSPAKMNSQPAPAPVSSRPAVIRPVAPAPLPKASGGEGSWQEF